MWIFISRHQGAIDWIKRSHNVKIDRFLPHLRENEIENLQEGDVLIGTFPLRIAADICARGARIFSIDMDTHMAVRGRDLTADEMDQYNARIAEYRIERL